ncbi:MAG: hypothetical protein K0R01_3157 [Mycobacterium sp.]|nr:hypothetical protein [Mycobacterium sp.]
MTARNDDDRPRTLAQPGRAGGRRKPPPPTFDGGQEQPAPRPQTARGSGRSTSPVPPDAVPPPPPGAQPIGRVPVARVPASEVRPAQPAPQEGTPQRGRGTPPPRREAPERPPTTSPNAAPVLTKRPPPFTVRVSQFLWVMSLLAGGIAVVYLFVIREDQVPLIADSVRTVAEGRSDETYTAAADIIFWSVFGIAVGLLLWQIVLLVSFSNRKPNVRWWQLATVVAQILLFLLSLEIIAVGDNGPLVRQVLLAQWGLALIALLFSTFRGALQWTARRHDIRRAGEDGGSEF